MKMKFCIYWPSSASFCFLPLVSDWWWKLVQLRRCRGRIDMRMVPTMHSRHVGDLAGTAAQRRLAQDSVWLALVQLSSLAMACRARGRVGQSSFTLWYGRIQCRNGGWTGHWWRIHIRVMLGYETFLWGTQLVFGATPLYISLLRIALIGPSQIFIFQIYHQQLDLIIIRHGQLSMLSVTFPNDFSQKYFSTAGCNYKEAKIQIILSKNQERDQLPHGLLMKLILRTIFVVVWMG